MADYENSTAVNDGNADAPAKGDEKILQESREGLQQCIEAESEQRQMMLDDLKFAALDQWPDDIRSMRENDLVNGPRPCLTVDQVNQYITQVSNDMRKNRPSIKTRPVDDIADPETAKIFQGLIRHIEDQSSAQIAYQTSGESAVTMGLGFFRIVADYVAPDSFDQELFIKRVPDTFSVYLSSHQMPDGSDAEKGWIFEKVPLATFKRDYPKAQVEDQDFVGLGVTPTWKTDSEIIVCEYFYKQYEQRELLYLADGTTMYRDDYNKLGGNGQQITGSRQSQKVTIRWCKHTGCEVLDKRDLPGKYLPIVEVVGKEKLVEGKRHLWGLVRPAKDSLRAFNYWISALTEKMALAPKAPFVGAVGQFATNSDKWQKANVNNYAYLEYDAIDVNGNALPAPKRQEPMQMEPAMAQMLSIMQNNVKSSLGMYKAALGQAESQQSGKAILALQRESDTGTMHFGDNQAISIAHGGRILVDLIPHYYDTKRVLRILGEDGQQQSVHVDPDLADADGNAIPKQEIQIAGRVKKIYNLGVGKYDVTVSTGPGYQTSRQEAATVMTELAQSAKDPASAAILTFGAIKNSDFHGSDEIQRMLKAMLPPPVLQADESNEPVPAAAMAKMAQMSQAMQQMQQAGAELQQENQQLKSGAQVQAAKVQSDSQAKQAELQLKAQVQAEELRLEREKAEAQLALDKAVAEAKFGIERMKLDFDMECRAKDDAAKRDEELKAKVQEEEAPLLQNALPMFKEMLTEVTQNFAVALQAQSQEIKALSQAVAAQSAAKHITLVQRDGRTVGAEVRTVQ